MNRGLFLLWLLIVAFPLQAKIYYFSSSIGDDSKNSGLSSESPFKSLSKVNSLLLNSGDQILFKKGDIWKGENIDIDFSGDSQSPITFGAYGSGAKPIISLRQRLTKTDITYNWSQYYGDTVWVMQTNPSSVTRLTRLWLDDIEYSVAYGTNEDNFDGTTGINSTHRFYHNATSHLLYVYSPHQNPADYYTKIEYSGKINSDGSTVYHTISIKDADYITIDGLDIRGGMYSAIGIGGSSYITIKNCNLGKYSQWAGVNGNSGFINSSGQTSDYVTIEEDTIYSDYTVNEYRQMSATCGVQYGVSMGQYGNTRYWKVRNNYIKDWAFGFYIIQKQDIDATHAEIYNNEITSPDGTYSKGGQIESDDSNHPELICKIYNNYFHDLKTGGINILAQNNTICFNVFTNITLSTNEHAGQGNSGYGLQILQALSSVEPNNNYIFNNTFNDLNSNAILDFTHNSEFYYNNLFTNCGKVLSMHYQVQDNAYSSNTWKNNLFFYPGFGLTGKLINISGVGRYSASEFNLLGTTSVGKTISGNLQYAGLVGGLLNTSNFTLPSGSPALNSGMDISNLVPSGFEDRYGNLVNTQHPNIGAIDNNNSDQSSIYLNTKIFLQGAYTNNGMSTALNSNGELPHNQPYNADPWNYPGNESVTSIPAGVVDWVLVEIRSDTSASSIVSRRAAFIKSDGTIVDLDGASNVNLDAKAGDYYIVVYHRNHLAVMSADKVSLSATSSLYDFTTSAGKYYGDEAADLRDGKFGMFAGDGDANGTINVLDYSSVTNNLFQSGYNSGDLDLQGTVTVIDYGETYMNLFRFSKVPGKL